jgi:hypothetical protein
MACLRVGQHQGINRIHFFLSVDFQRSILLKSFCGRAYQQQLDCESEHGRFPFVPTILKPLLRRAHTEILIY